MRTLLIAAAVAFCSSSARADDAKPDAKAAAVVEKAIEAFGGKAALEKYPASTAKMKGEISIMGIDLEFTGDMAYSVPDKFRITIAADFMGQKLNITQMVSGDKVKMTLNGMEPPLPDGAKDEIRSQLAAQEMSQITPLLDPKKFTIKLADEVEVGGKKADVVVVSGPKLKGKEVSLYFDKESHLLVKTTRKGLSGDGMKEVDEETTFSDYQKVQGVMTPMKTVTKQDGKPFMSVTFSEIKMLEKLDPKDFASDD